MLLSKMAAVALIVCLLLRCTGDCPSSFFRRVGFLTAFGIFLALAAHVSCYNWMMLPTDFAAGGILEMFGGCFLAGPVIAAIAGVKPASPPLSE